MHEPTIYIDMDGVLSDFVQGALDLFQQPDALSDWPLGSHRVAQVLGVSGTEFWKRIDASGSSFWSELAPYPWVAELLTLVDSYPWYILTSPSRDGSSADGKMQWMRRYLGDDFRRYLISPQKQLLANSNSILIDDLDPNIERFETAGGTGILFPRKWNANHRLADKPLAYVQQRLADFAGQN